MNNLKILMLDDDASWRSIISDYLKNIDQIDLVSTCETVDQAVEILKNNKIDIVLLDLNLSRLEYDGIDAAAKLRKITNAKIIMLAVSESKMMIEKVIIAGAVDCVLKGEFKEALIASIKRAYFSSCSEMISEIIRKKEVALMLSGLSKCEREIIEKCCMDKKSDEIQKELHYQKQAYWNSVNKIKKKLHLRSLKEAVDYIKNYS